MIELLCFILIIVISILKDKMSENKLFLLISFLFFIGMLIITYLLGTINEFIRIIVITIIIIFILRFIFGPGITIINLVNYWFDKTNIDKINKLTYKRRIKVAKKALEDNNIDLFLSINLCNEDIFLLIPSKKFFLDTIKKRNIKEVIVLLKKFNFINQSYGFILITNDVYNLLDLKLNELISENKTKDIIYLSYVFHNIYPLHKKILKYFEKNNIKIYDSIVREVIVEMEKEFNLLKKTDFESYLYSHTEIKMFNLPPKTVRVTLEKHYSDLGSFIEDNVDGHLIRYYEDKNMYFIDGIRILSLEGFMAFCNMFVYDSIYREYLPNSTANSSRIINERIKYQKMIRKYENDNILTDNDELGLYIKAKQKSKVRVKEACKFVIYYVDSKPVFVSKIDLILSIDNKNTIANIVRSYAHSYECIRLEMLILKEAYNHCYKKDVKNLMYIKFINNKCNIKNIDIQKIYYNETNFDNIYRKRVKFLFEQSIN